MRALILLGTAACSAPGAPPATPAAVAVLPDVPFALLDREQRARFMEERVVPAMAPLFRAYDAERFAAFTCKTCHGAEEHEFAMPNPALPRLALPGLAGHDPRAVAWMREQIAPAMARLLGAPEVTCLRCHVGDRR